MGVNTVLWAFVGAWTLIGAALFWVGVRAVRWIKGSWFRRQVTGLVFMVVFVGVLLASSFLASVRAGAGWLAFALGFGIGFAAITAEAINAWRKGTFVVHDPAAIAEAREHNRQLARLLIVPGVLFASVLMRSSESMQALVQGLGGGYLVPFVTAACVRFARHHEEIERLTLGRVASR